HHAHVSFFVSGFAAMSVRQRAMLTQLAAEGHAIEAHSVSHPLAHDYVAARGIEAYLAEEAIPSIAQLRAAGFPATVYAYPYGDHFEGLDRALLASHVARVRAGRSQCPD